MTYTWTDAQINAALLATQVNATLFSEPQHIETTTLSAALHMSARSGPRGSGFADLSRVNSAMKAVSQYLSKNKETE